MQTAIYTQPATRLTPALVIYLVDASSSMNDPCGPTTKMALVNAALKEAVKGMILRSMRDIKVQPRYHLAMFAYSNKVINVFNGIQPLPEVMRVGGPPELSAGDDATDTATAFVAVEQFLQRHLHSYQHCPAPLICHLTDALLTTHDPTPAVQRIRAMHVDDGPVLVENILMAEQILRKPVKNWYAWHGVRKATELKDEFAQRLFMLSSPLPETYRQTINTTAGYRLQKGAALFFPGTQAELVRLALAASSATQI